MCSPRISKCLLVATKSLSTEIQYSMLERTDAIALILLDTYLTSRYVYPSLSTKSDVTQKFSFLEKEKNYFSI